MRRQTCYIRLLTFDSWPIDGIKIPGFFRKHLEHKVVELKDYETNLQYAYDDEVGRLGCYHYKWADFLRSSGFL